MRQEGRKGKKPLQRVLMSRLPLWTSGTQLRESPEAENPAWSNKPVTCMRTLCMWELGRGGMILGRIPVAYLDHKGLIFGVTNCQSSIIGSRSCS